MACQDEIICTRMDKNGNLGLPVLLFPLFDLGMFFACLELISKTMQGNQTKFETLIHVVGIHILLICYRICKLYIFENMNPTYRCNALGTKILCTFSLLYLLFFRLKLH